MSKTTSRRRTFQTNFYSYFIFVTVEVALYNSPQERKWKLFISQYYANLTQPKECKENHICAILIPELTTLGLLGLNFLELFCTSFSMSAVKGFRALKIMGK